MPRSPAFQFYPNDWLSSTHITLMSPAEEGAYIRLLSIAWNSEDCGLPDDDNVLSVLSRLGEGWFSGSSQKVRQCFYIDAGRLYNKRLLKERQKQDEWLKKSSDAGKKSWQVRKKQGQMTQKGWAKVGSQMVQTIHEPKPNSSSSSSSSSSKKNNTIPDFISSEAWFAFKDHRKLKRAPLTHRAEELILKKLEKWKNEHGWNPDDILNQSIENGWTGIFELKNGDGFKPKKPDKPEYRIPESVLPEIKSISEEERLRVLKMMGKG
jgi:uncharacterized protein YdaU (DUF1376 family)